MNKSFNKEWFVGSYSFERINDDLATSDSLKYLLKMKEAWFFENAFKSGFLKYIINTIILNFSNLNLIIKIKPMHINKI